MRHAIDPPVGDLVGQDHAVLRRHLIPGWLAAPRRHGRLLAQEQPFMHEMVLAVRDEMAVAYPELKESAERVAKVVLAEELRFERVMERGSRELSMKLNDENSRVRTARLA